MAALLVCLLDKGYSRAFTSARMGQSEQMQLCIAKSTGEPITNCCWAATGVTRLRVGDRVFGIAPGCLGSSVLVHEDLMVPLPAHVSFSEGATTPIVFCTVFAALGPALPTIRNQQVRPMSEFHGFLPPIWGSKGPLCLFSTHHRWHPEFNPACNVADPHAWKFLLCFEHTM